MGAAKAQIHLFSVIGQLGTSYGSLACIMGKVAGSIFFLDQERIGGILDMRCSDPHFPFQLGCIGTQINKGTALVHIDAGSHIRITVPEKLLVGSVQDISPECTFRFCIGLLTAEVICKFRHGHIFQLTFLLQLSIVGHTIFIRLFQQLIGCLPASHLV